MKTYIVTYAQDKTPVHAGFWASLMNCAKHKQAPILAIAGTYRNPTSKHEKHFEDAEGDEAYAEEVRPHLLRTRKKLCRNLTVYGEMRIQPTATNPLSGFEVFASGTSAIVGHTKRALQVVPTEGRNPRVLWSTSACTVANYSNSKAGQKGKAHHVLGALIVEIDRDGTYFCRHVSADSRGSFTDLDKRYTPSGVEDAPRALSLTLGDLHVGRDDLAVLGATRRLYDLIKPKYVVLHDVLDFSSRNHHERTAKALYARRFDTPEREVEHTVEGVNHIADWGPHRTVVVRSNHDEHFERWVEEFVPHKDPVNIPYYHDVSSRMYAHHKRTGEWPMLFEQEARRLGVRKSVRFLRRNDSLKLAGVEHGFHGDKGNGGARGTPQAYVKLGTKTTTAHTHTPRIMDGNYTVGVTAERDHGYNLLPSTWLNAHCTLYADGKRQIVIVVNGRFAGGQL